MFQLYRLDKCLTTHDLKEGRAYIMDSGRVGYYIGFSGKRFYFLLCGSLLMEQSNFVNSEGTEKFKAKVLLNERLQLSCIKNLCNETAKLLNENAGNIVAANMTPYDFGIVSSMPKILSELKDVVILNHRDIIKNNSIGVGMHVDWSMVSFFKWLKKWEGRDKQEFKALPEKIQLSLRAQYKKFKETDWGF